MQFFGEGRCPDGIERRVPAPVGEKCSWCHEPVGAGDSGYILPHWQFVPTVDQGAWGKPVHLECFLRQIVGSVGHQQGRCSCHGGDESDPPGMTRREAARAAVEMYRRKEGAR